MEGRARHGIWWWPCATHWLSSAWARALLVTLCLAWDCPTDLQCYPTFSLVFAVTVSIISIWSRTKVIYQEWAYQGCGFFSSLLVKGGVMLTWHQGCIKPRNCMWGPQIMNLTHFLICFLSPCFLIKNAEEEPGMGRLKSSPILGEEDIYFRK